MVKTYNEIEKRMKRQSKNKVVKKREQSGTFRGEHEEVCEMYTV